MLKRLRLIGRNQKGFTLIELLIVIAILGILAAVVIPNVGTFFKTGTVNAANTEEQNVETAVLVYYSDNNFTYPADSSALTGYLSGTPKATYSFNTLGQITGVTGVSWTGVTFDTSKPLGQRNWVKAP